MTMRELHVGPVPVRALRISYVGELGWEIYAPPEFGLALWDALTEAGAPHGLAHCGGAAYDSLRLEKGYRLWGADIDEEHDPWEAGLGFAVKLGKGDFLGREAAARAKERGQPPALLPDDGRSLRSCSWARSRSSTPPGSRDRLRHERRLRRDGRREHRPTATCRSRTPSRGRASASGATAP